MKFWIWIFGGLYSIMLIIVLVFSLLVIDQIAKLARLSFTDTATMAPMVIVGILRKKKLPLQFH